MDVIQGYVGFIEWETPSKEIIKYYLLSRRGWARGGTRFKHRGVDNQGNVANFVESEQVILYGNQTAAHTQLRGSVPLFWQ